MNQRCEDDFHKLDSNLTEYRTELKNLEKAYDQHWNDDEETIMKRSRTILKVFVNKSTITCGLFLDLLLSISQPLWI